MSTTFVPNTSIEHPLDLINLSLGERVYVKLRGERELRGKLHYFDLHLNLILSDVEETHTVIEFNETTMEEIHKPTKRKMDLLYVRGDGVILVAPPARV